MRKSIREGAEATVVGWAEADSHKVIIKVLLSHEKGGAPVEVTHATVPGNLRFMSEDLNSTTKAESSKGLGEPKGLDDPASSSGTIKKRSLSWALLDSAPEQVLEEPKWPKLLADKDHLCQACALCSRIWGPDGGPCWCAP